MRRFAMVLVALLMAGGPAVADKVDPAVMAMLREWSLTSPSPFRVVICHGFGCLFRTEIALTSGDHAQMAAIMASGSASAQAERAAIGRTEAWFERRIAPITGTTMRVARAGALIGLAGRDPGSQDQRALDGRSLDAQGQRSSRYLAARKVEGGRMKSEERPRTCAPRACAD